MINEPIEHPVINEPVDTKRIRIVSTDGVGSNSKNVIRVDGKRWALVEYMGRMGWAIRDAEYFKVAHGENKAAATQQALRLIEEGRFPTPEQAWRSAVERVVANGINEGRAAHSTTLFAAVIDFIEMAKGNPAIRAMNSFQRLVGEIEAIFDHGSKTLDRNLDIDKRILESALASKPAQSGHLKLSSEEIERRHAEYVASQKAQYEDAERRVRYALELLAENKEPIKDAR